MPDALDSELPTKALKEPPRDNIVSPSLLIQSRSMSRWTLIKESRQEWAGQSHQPAVEEALGYFVRNVGRMQRGTFRKAGYSIGSGIVEAGCKTVIGGRCKQSGMFWSKSGA